MLQEESSDISPYEHTEITWKVIQSTLALQQTLAQKRDDADKLAIEISLLERNLALKQKLLDTLCSTAQRHVFDIPELREEIFSFALSRHSFRDLAVRSSILSTLGSVCQIWRQTTLDTPHFWNKIKISNLESQDSTVLPFLQNRLFLWLHRSLPLSIDIFIDATETGMREPSIFKILMVPLLHHKYRWRNVSLFLCPTYFKVIFPLKNMPLIQRFCASGHVDDSELISESPSLQILSVYSQTFLHNPNFPWVQLRYLHIDVPDETSGFCIPSNLLARSPNLIELRINSSSQPVSGQEQTSSMTHNGLTHLSLESEIDVSMWSLPNLLSFQCLAHNTTQFSPLVEQSTALTTIWIGEVGQHSRIFALASPSVTALYLRMDYSYDSCDAGLNYDDLSRCFPSLKHLEIDASLSWSLDYCRPIYHDVVLLDSALPSDSPLSIHLAIPIPWRRHMLGIPLHHTTITHSPIMDWCLNKCWY